MSTDLERRLHDELHDRASDAMAWRQGGASLRRTAAARRSHRLRTGAVVAAAASVLAVVAGVSLGTDGRPDSAPAGPTSSPTVTDAATGPRPELIQAPVSDALARRAMQEFALGRAELLATVTLPQSRETVLVISSQLDGARFAFVQTVTVHGDRLLAGTRATYRPGDLIAQPARDGDGNHSSLVVVAPRGTDADTVEITTSLPGKDIRPRLVRLDSGLATLPLPSPTSVTRLRLLHEGSVVEDRIPADFNLSDSVPRPLSRVVVSTSSYQPVQVRTDGRSACRFTTRGLEPPETFVLEWNPFDEACATIDPSKLQLLIAKDARYSSVAGVAPPGTGFVRLHWRNGDVTDVPVADDEVPAFVDTSGHRPDRLTLAQAISTAGDETARVDP